MRTEFCPEVLEEDFMGCVLPFMDKLLQLQDEDLMHCQVFINAAKTRNAELSSFDMRSVMENFIDDSFSVVTGLCEPLYTDPGSMLVVDAEHIFKGVTTTNLKREINFIQGCFDNREMERNRITVLLERFIEFPEIHKNVQELNNLLKIVNLEDDHLYINTRESYEDLNEMYEATNEVSHIEYLLCGSPGEVIKELSDSKSLIKLLQETANDDVRNLIDAVEERSDSTVAAKEVSDFIEVHRILSPVFKAKP